MVSSQKHLFKWQSRHCGDAQMSRTFRHVNYCNRSMSPWMKCEKRLTELGVYTPSRSRPFWEHDPRDSYDMGYDGKPRSQRTEGVLLRSKNP